METRFKSGESHPSAKLTEGKVREIKLHLKEGKLEQKELAAMFGIGTTTMNKIAKGHIWKNVSLN